MDATGEWIAVEWIRQGDLDKNNSDAITIRAQRSPFYQGVKFAVRDHSQVLSIDGMWVYEPTPSERDDEFYRRFRFPTFESAVAKLKEVRE